MRCQNDSVTTQPMLEITAKRPKLVSPTGDESSSRLPSPILPEELILEILLRVPVRSLLQFRCVSKSWKTLISDPQFAKDHLRTSIADPNMSHQRLVSPIFGNPRKMAFFSVQSLSQNPSTPAKPLFYFKTRRKYRILGSCNGLLCLFSVHQRFVRLWNPSIRLKSKRLSIGGSPDVEITYHGFGYDHVNDKYKLLLATRDLHDQKIVTKIYCFSSNSCTVIPNFPCHPTKMEGKFVSGTLNWIAKGGVSDNQWVILSLDMATEIYDEALLTYGNGDDKIIYPVLGVSRNCLCVCFFDSNKAHWVVWLMKEYGVENSWIELIAIPHVVEDTLTGLMMIPQDQRGICRWRHSLDPLCISENGFVLVKTRFFKLVLYNLNDGWVDYHRFRKALLVDYLQIYHESLVSPRR